MKHTAKIIWGEKKSTKINRVKVLEEVKAQSKKIAVKFHRT